MSDDIKPIRRVVTGNDAHGRSCVLFDSAAPNVKTSPFQKGTNMTDIWVFHSCPAVITGARPVTVGSLADHLAPFFEGFKNHGYVEILSEGILDSDLNIVKVDEDS